MITYSRLGNVSHGGIEKEPVPAFHSQMSQVHQSTSNCKFKLHDGLILLSPSRHKYIQTECSALIASKILQSPPEKKKRSAPLSSNSLTTPERKIIDSQDDVNPRSPYDQKIY